MDDSNPTIRQVARWLRREFPVKAGTGRVRCRVFAEQSLHGYCTAGGAVSINSYFSMSNQRETLLHEWAHVRVGWNREEHSQEFWKELGRITNAYHIWKDARDDVS